MMVSGSLLQHCPYTISSYSSHQCYEIGTVTKTHFTDKEIEDREVQHYCYLLVMVCTFSGWVEAFPTWTERASEVARCLLTEVVPRFGFPTSIGSDSGPTFVADLVQQVSKT